MLINPSNESPRTRQNRMKTKRWLEYYNKHKKRIQSMKPTITATNHNDTYDYLHLQLRLKKLQMEEDRLAQIDYENRRLLEKVINVTGRQNPQKTNHTNAFRQSVISHERKMNLEKINRENKSLQERIDQVRPLSFSAPAESSLMRETRERERMLQDRLVKKQNEDLKKKIDDVKPRLSFSPPYSMKYPPPHDTFESQFKSYSLSIQKENENIDERLKAITDRKLEPMPPLQRIPASHQFRRSFSEDNKLLQQRLVQVSSSINFEKWQTEFETNRSKPMKRNNVEEEDRIKIENQKMHERLLKITETTKKLPKNQLKSNKKQDEWQKKFQSLQKSIEEKNKAFHQRIQNVKPVTNTKKEDPSCESVPYYDDYYWKNKRLKERLRQIKKGKKPVPLKQDGELYPRAAMRIREDTPDFSSDSEAELQDETPVETKKVEKKKAAKKKKDYVVPEGYRKKFRKTRKKSNADPMQGSDSEPTASDSDTDTN